MISDREAMMPLLAILNATTVDRGYHVSNFEAGWTQDGRVWLDEYHSDSLDSRRINGVGL
jgi:hypothetical protein